MRIINLDQRSTDWEVWRNRGIGSSDATILVLGSYFDRDIKSLYYEKIGTPLNKEPTTQEETAAHKKKVSAMNRGTELEPAGRDYYEKLIGYKAPPICVIHDDYEFIKASLDGWIEELNIILEIKAPNKFVHQAALDGEVSDVYKSQLDHQLLITGGNVAHFVSIGSYLFKGTDKFALVKYKRNQERIDDLLAKEINFWHNVQCRVPPV